jgi:flagellar hook assembly protein FlgD
MKLFSRALFAVLVLATVAAFFVAAKIKNTPSIVQKVRHPNLISPNGDGLKDSAGISLRLKKADRVTITIVDADGDHVRTVLDDRKLGAYQQLPGSAARWDGRDEHGHVVADGLYRVWITLRDQGRTVIDTRSITVDTSPPKPTVTRVVPNDGGPAILPRTNGGDVTAIFKRARADATISVAQTSPQRREVLTKKLKPGTTQWSWDGTVDGKRVPAGTYVVIARWRDEAGNVGTSVPVDANGVPILGKPSLPGKGGVTVRYVSASPPADPVKAGGKASFSVDTRGQKYRWSLRRIGGSTIKRGRADRTPLTINIPRAKSGLYSLGVTTGSHSSQAPFVVNGTSKQGGGPEDKQGVLVVAPTYTWQGRNPVDDDGDGSPNLLDYGADAQFLNSPGHQRAYAGTGLPVGLLSHEAQVFKWLDDNDHSYDVATDSELNTDPRLLRGYRGVILAGDALWLTDAQRSRLKRFVGDGGTLMSIGTSSLRRTVDYSGKDGKLTDPSKPAPDDLFGAQITRLSSTPTGLENFGEDEIDLFGRTSGAIAGVTGWEQTVKVGPDAEKVASAVTADTTPPGKTVTVAVKYGDGLVIRPGFDTFSQRLGSDTSVDGLMDGAWALLSR